MTHTLRKQDDSDQHMVVITTIAGGIDVKKMNAGYRKAHGSLAK